MYKGHSNTAIVVDTVVRCSDTVRKEYTMQQEAPILATTLCQHYDIRNHFVSWPSSLGYRVPSMSAGTYSGLSSVGLSTSGGYVTSVMAMIPTVRVSASTLIMKQVRSTIVPFTTPRKPEINICKELVRYDNALDHNNNITKSLSVSRFFTIQLAEMSSTVLVNHMGSMLDKKAESKACRALVVYRKPVEFNEPNMAVLVNVPIENTHCQGLRLTNHYHQTGSGMELIHVPRVAEDTVKEWKQHAMKCKLRHTPGFTILTLG